MRMRQKFSSVLRRERRGPTLNVIAVIVAACGLTFSLVAGSPKDFGLTAERLAASAGVSTSASVPANPYNTLAAQLSAKEQALNDREAQIAAKGSVAPTQNSWGDMFGFFSFCMSIMLFVLVAINFYRDSQRGKTTIPLARKFLVDMR